MQRSQRGFAIDLFKANKSIKEVKDTVEKVYGINCLTKDSFYRIRRLVKAERPEGDVDRRSMGNAKGKRAWSDQAIEGVRAFVGIDGRCTVR